MCHYFSNYAYDTTPYAIGGNTKEVLTRLTDITQKIFAWFANNQIKANHDKCDLQMVSVAFRPAALLKRDSSKGAFL